MELVIIFLGFFLRHSKRKKRLSFYMLRIQANLNIVVSPPQMFPLRNLTLKEIRYQIKLQFEVILI